MFVVIKSKFFGRQAVLTPLRASQMTTAGKSGVTEAGKDEQHLLKDREPLGSGSGLTLTSEALTSGDGECSGESGKGTLGGSGVTVAGEEGKGGR